MKGLAGVKYALLIVAGINCKFICNAAMVTNPPRDFVAEVIIFQLLSAEGTYPVIAGISEMNEYLERYKTQHFGTCHYVEPFFF